MTNNNTANDNFTEAAREEFYRVWHSPIHDHSQIGMAIHMAEWARDHLAAQEPTEEEVEAAAQSVIGPAATFRVATIA